MGRARLRILIGIAVFVAATAAGASLALRLLDRDLLRAECESWLARKLDTRVSVGSVTPVVGRGLGLDGRAVKLWTTSSGWGLTAERVSVRFRPLSLLLGKPRLSRIVLEGGRLRIERSVADTWSEPFERLDPDPPTGLPPHPDELLSPLIGLENFVRGLLDGVRLADDLVVHRSEIVFSDARAGAPGSPLELSLADFSGRLRRHRLVGGVELSARARLVRDGGDEGGVAWDGRSRGGALRFATAATELRLRVLEPYVRGLRPAPRIEGTVSGAVVFETDAPGSGRLELDLAGRDMSSVFPPQDAEVFHPIRWKWATLRGALEIAPQIVRVRDLRVAASDLEVELDGTLERPLHAGSRAQLSTALRGVDVEQVRHIIGWLPEVRREEAASLLRPVRAGRMKLLRVGGDATFSAWQAFLAGRSRVLPEGWVVDAQLQDAAVLSGEDDRIEGLSGRLWWSGDHLELQGARASLNGSALPELDVALDGVTHFFAVDPARRKLVSDAEPLTGLEALWRVLGLDEEDEEPPEMRTTVQLAFDRLEHPMFLWPIAKLVAAIEPIEGGVHILTRDGTWGGLPVRGDARWLFEPTERVDVRMTLERAEDEPPPEELDPDAPRAWAVGRFAVGPVDEKAWHQRSASGRFEASRGRVVFPEIRIDLDPSGRLDAYGEIDLTRPDGVPIDVSFAMTGGDVSTLASQLGLPPEVATGRADAGGRLAGWLRPDVMPLAEMDGRVGLLAVNGNIRRAVPPIVAVALASRSFNPFTRRDEVRYERVETLLEFEHGNTRTESFSVDGPDVRVFASGTLGLREPFPIDGKVALYLFRQIDSLVEKIPLVNLILLGTDDNLAAAFFELSGPWENPKARLIPLRSLASVPGPPAVIQGVHTFLLRGMRAIGSLWETAPGDGAGKAGETDTLPAQPAPPPRSES